MRTFRLALLIGGLASGSASGAWAQTLDQALASAYDANPSLNSQRAATRAVDEYVPIALSGYRPQIFGSASIGSQWVEGRYDAGVGSVTSHYKTDPSSFGITISQTIYDGLKTANSVRGAEAQVKGQRELLRNTEQTVLLDAATAYMNVLEDGALLELRRQNLTAFEEELKSARQRFAVGEITRTDVAQAEASVADAKSTLAEATANLKTANAVFVRVTQLQPQKLSPARPVDGLLPASLDAALASGLTRHPAIRAAQYAMDQSATEVKVAEAALSPTLSLNGSATNQYNYYSDGDRIERGTDVAATLNLSVPIYQGGAEYSSIRQSKEKLTQARIDIDTERDQVRASVQQYWSGLQAAKAAIESAQASVAANEIALKGVREEWRVGQRTTLDVLNAQTSLFEARASLVTAQRDRVVASFSLLSSVGELSAGTLKLKVRAYNPKVHYDQVRDAWIGVRTPGGQ
ncbi:TolC family outer membrane protein [Ancylobacter mangrovi]|uniref:TolC family outer membrane protein n=1 Tax=Ancylobacter mangrovi TaxID=2972472 RepID=UPI00216327CD|nr:TolC family outer membrane protein [Ancylobacter mangrovi]MCS0504180.1 TolC family outer membrane protein [Ancylobacter mangrovi]